MPEGVATYMELAYAVEGVMNANGVRLSFVKKVIKNNKRERKKLEDSVRWTLEQDWFATMLKEAIGKTAFTGEAPVEHVVNILLTK